MEEIIRQLAVRPSPAFAALNEPSAEAWQSVAEQPPPSLGQVLESSGPVEMACLAWRMAQDREGAQELFEGISTSFAASLERCHRETLGLARSVVEAGRQKCLIEGTSDWLLRVKSRLEDSRLAAFCASRFDALRCLADAYQADELRSIGDLDTATDLIEAALSAVPEGETEIRSRILEIASSAAAHVGATTRAGELLLEAQNLLEPGGPLAQRPRFGAAARAARLAEIRLSQARILIRERRSYQARGLLLLALDTLPAGRALRLKLEIHHELLGLHVARGDVAAAEAVLGAGAALYGHAVSDPLLRAERDRLRGRLAFDQGRFDDALTFLIPSIGILLTLKRYPDALAALEELRRALLKCENPDPWKPQARGLLGRFISRAPGIEAVGPVYLQVLAELARNLDVDFELGEFLGTRHTVERVH